jgi:hypothetical protein
MWILGLAFSKLLLRFLFNESNRSRAALGARALFRNTRCILHFELMPTSQTLETARLCHDSPLLSPLDSRQWSVDGDQK